MIKNGKRGKQKRKKRNMKKRKEGSTTINEHEKKEKKSKCKKKQITINKTNFERRKKYSRKNKKQNKKTRKRKTKTRPPFPRKKISPDGSISHAAGIYRSECPDAPLTRSSRRPCCRVRSACLRPFKPAMKGPKLSGITSYLLGLEGSSLGNFIGVSLFWWECECVCVCVYFML